MTLKYKKRKKHTWKRLVQKNAKVLYRKPAVRTEKNRVATITTAKNCSQCYTKQAKNYEDELATDYKARSTSQI